jgi:hypothetical protein
MRKTCCSRMNCVIYKQLAGIRISETDRQRAAYALRDAEAIANGVIWVRERIASLGAIVLKPSFKQS